MSNFSSWLNGTKRELNRQFNLKKPAIISAVTAEIALHRGDWQGEDVLKDGLISVVKSLKVFGPASFLVEGLIASLPIKKSVSLDDLQALLIQKINGARL